MELIWKLTWIIQVISVTNVNDAQFSTKLLAQTTLRNVLGTKTLSEILTERDNISSITEKVLDDGTDPWGVKVERVEIKVAYLMHPNSLLYPIAFPGFLGYPAPSPADAQHGHGS